MLLIFKAIQIYKMKKSVRWLTKMGKNKQELPDNDKPEVTPRKRAMKT